jgi:tRNA1(Val) A37 N6-methylase TrmN6
LPPRSAVTAAESGTSEDAVLGGRLLLRQPLKGHRVGHDAILLAAATAAHAGDHVVDLGAGVGGAGLALARRVPGVTVILAEIDPALAALAQENAARNGFAKNVRAVCLDVTGSPAAFAAAGLTAGAADHVTMNPPFNAPHNPSPDGARRLAHSAPPDLLARWFAAAAWLLRSGGALTLIWRADALDSVLAALSTDFGAVTVLPVHPKPDAPAIRVLVRAVKASDAPLTLLPGFYLNDAVGKATAEAEAVLRGAGTLRLAEI